MDLIDAVLNAQFKLTGNVKQTICHTALFHHSLLNCEATKMNDAITQSFCWHIFPVHTKRVAYMYIILIHQMQFATFSLRKKNNVVNKIRKSRPGDG